MEEGNELEREGRERGDKEGEEKIGVASERAGSRALE